MNSNDLNEEMIHEFESMCIEFFAKKQVLVWKKTSDIEGL